MKANIGTLDRAIRIIVGLGLIAYGVVNQNWIGAIGLLPLLTGLMRWCPAYLPLGLSTCGKDSGPKGGCGCGDGRCG